MAQGPDAKGWDGFEALVLRAADELHVDSFVSDATWQALSARYDTNQLVDLVDAVGVFTLHAGAINSLGVEIEPDVPDRLPSGIPYSVAAKRTNLRLVDKGARIPPLEPKDWTPEQRKRFDPNGTGQRAANVFVTFVRNPPADRLRGPINQHVLNGTTLSVRQRETLLMRIGVLCRSEYEWAAHSRLGRRAGMMTDADVARIIAGPDAGGGDPLETALLRATDELYRDDRVSDDTWAALAEGSRYETTARRADRGRRLSIRLDGDQQRRRATRRQHGGLPIPAVVAIGVAPFTIMPSDHSSDCRDCLSTIVAGRSLTARHNVSVGRRLSRTHQPREAHVSLLVRGASSARPR